MGIDKFTNETKYETLTSESAGTAEQLGREASFNKCTKTYEKTNKQNKPLNRTPALC